MSLSVAILGIDPGVRGGLAVLRADGSVAHVAAFDPDGTESDVAVAMKVAVDNLGIAGGGQCFMEKVGYIAGDGGQGAFTFGRIVGLIRGCLLTRGIYPHDVYPTMWQTALGCLTGGNKNISKRRAKELFPEQKMTHAIADALLISEYGRRRVSI